MDEILIGDKKYISSKQAAKATGYAKDYIGQLCREGRVPARLVGRSWYVLESAIHDHRFGEVKQQKETKPAAEHWESPRYEADHEEFPAITHLIEEERSAPAGDQEDTLSVGQTPELMSQVSEQLQDAWKSWFERVSEEKPAQKTETSSKFEEDSAAEESVSVPIRTVYTHPPVELLPRKMELDIVEEEESVPIQSQSGPKHASMRRVLLSAHLVGGIVAVLIAIAAIVNTGYLDKYIASYNQVSSFTGVIMHNK